MMDLCSSPTLISDSGFPEVPQTMYDPLENKFIGIHPWSGLFRDDNTLPFWIMKRRDMDVDDCPHLLAYCSLVEHRWNKLRTRTTDEPLALYEHPSTPLPSTPLPSTPLPSALFPTPIPSTLHPFSSVPPLPSLSSSPVPLLSPISFSPVPHLPALKSSADDDSTHDIESPDKSQLSESLGKRKHSPTPFSIGSIGTINITINVKEEDAEVSLISIDNNIYSPVATD